MNQDDQGFVLMAAAQAHYAKEQARREARKAALLEPSIGFIQFKSANGPEAAGRAGAINQSRSAANRARELRLGLRDGCRRHRVSRLRFVHLDSNGSRPLKKPARYSVAEAARQVGYESPSQFSREYKRLFGGTPKETAGRSRSSIFTF